MDEETLKKFHDGDHTTFNKIMQEYQKPIYYFILRMTGNVKDAEDITQETFVKAYTERQNFRGDSAVNTWIYRIAANLSKNHLRWNSIRNHLAIDKMADLLTSDTDSSRYEAIETLESELIPYLEELPPRQRSVFILKYFDGLSHEEVANILSISVSSSKTNFHYAVKSLKEMIGADNE